MHDGLWVRVIKHRSSKYKYGNIFTPVEKCVSIKFLKNLPL